MNNGANKSETVILEQHVGGNHRLYLCSETASDFLADMRCQSENFLNKGSGQIVKIELLAGGKSLHLHVKI